MAQTKVPKKINIQVTELLRESLAQLIDEFWESRQEQFEIALVDSGGKLGFTISGKIDADKPMAEMKVNLSFHKQVKGSYQATVDDPDQEQLSFVGGEAGLGTNAVTMATTMAKATKLSKKERKKKASTKKKTVAKKKLSKEKL